MMIMESQLVYVSNQLFNKYTSVTLKVKLVTWQAHIHLHLIEFLVQM